MGVPTEHAGILGNGLWAHFIRQSFQDNGITHIGQDRLDEDSGFRVVLSSGAPKKTFIASYGAEAHGDSDTFDTLEPQPKDVVHISGNTLMDHTATGVDGFLLKAGTDPAARDYTLVINPTNTLRLVNDHMLEDWCSHARSGPATVRSHDAGRATWCANRRQQSHHWRRT